MMTHKKLSLLVCALAAVPVACGSSDEPAGPAVAGAPGAGAPGTGGMAMSGAGAPATPAASGAAGASVAAAGVGGADTGAAGMVGNGGSSAGASAAGSGMGGSLPVAGSGGTLGAAGGSAGGGMAGAGTAGAGGAGCTVATGKGLQFDNAAIDLMTGDLGADFPGGDVPRTIELWAKFLGAQSWKAEGSIIETGMRKTAGNQVFGIDLSGYTGTTAQFGPYTNGYSDNNNPNGVFVMSTPQTGWLHLSWSYTGNHGALSFTVNGVEYPTKNTGGQATMAFTQGIVTLGGSQSFGFQGWSGVMDELKLWSVAKTPAQILANMKVVSKGTEPGLAAYYRFDEGSGDFTDDVTKKASHRLTLCTATSAICNAVNTAKPTWVTSDIPGPFTCAP